ncbi:acyl-CoA binding domain-containing protein 6 [Apophysomyces ossiformis]|uniref:Acyl-CoA binding domain-containing protein 6 n=1 Tax=Apophysomyces ossiformis TaxID=679940 RepID=A0A8H7EU87_9FUNG|nr:acyl-CoA binding domain-containing protein 6 [Apophysomyces ossiformis]
MSSMQAKEDYILLVESLQMGWSRQGEYEYETKEEDDEGVKGMGNAVSSMAREEDESDDDLFSAARQNALEKVKEYIVQGQDINEQDDNATLHYACDRGHLEMAQLLKELGADINAKTHDTETPLHYGTFGNQAADKADKRNYIACISDQLEVAVWLVQNNCDLSVRDAEGLTAFEQADSGFVERVQSSCNM